MTKYEIVDWVVNSLNLYKINQDYKFSISQNPHDAAVDMLLERPELIDVSGLFANSNPRVEDKILQNFKFLISLDNNNQDSVTHTLQQNFCGNSNDKFVRIIISMADRLKYYIFANSNPKVVDYILQHMDRYKSYLDEGDEMEIARYYICKNEDPRIVDFVFKNPQYIYLDSWASNANDRVVDYVLQNEEKIEEKIDVVFNRNKRMLPLIKKIFLSEDEPNYYILSNPLIFVVDRRTSCIKYKIVDWMDINTKNLSGNPHNIAMDILERNKNKIDLSKLSRNPNPKAICLLLDKQPFLWNELSANPNDAAVDILLENPGQIDYKEFSSNINNRIFPLLRKNLDRASWYLVSKNPNDRAIDILIENKDNIDWDGIASNPNNRAVDIIFSNLGKINKSLLSLNSNDKVVNFLLENPRMIDWTYFAGNENDMAIPHIGKHIPDINRYEFLIKNKNPKILPVISQVRKSLSNNDKALLAENPIIFELDYKEIKNCMNDMKKELIEKTMNPKQLERKIRKERWRIVRERENKKTYDSKPIVTPENDPPWLEDVDVDLDRIL